MPINLSIKNVPDDVARGLRNRAAKDAEQERAARRFRDLLARPDGDRSEERSNGE